MKAITLVKFGPSSKAFELREMPDPVPGEGQVLIKAEAFGLNFADVVARHGQYQDCPPLPAVIGYETVGTIEKLGTGVTNVKVGDRVAAFSRFGGYATHVVTDHRAVAVIPKDMDAGIACSLTTQYGTAWYLAEEMSSLHPGDKVLIHAAAGGVGTALIQIVKRRGCIIFGTAGSEAKLKYLSEQGVHHPINYQESDFAEEIRKLGFDKKIDVIFDPVGGSSVKKGVSLLNSGGQIICFGASEMTGHGKNPIKMIGILLGFGIWSPIQLMLRSISLSGLNMLRIADNKPEALQRCLQEVVKLTLAGELKPTVGATFTADRIAEAHDYLESRKSIGKVLVTW